MSRRAVLQGYLLLHSVHAVRVLENVVDRAQLGLLDTIRANRLLAQRLSAQLDAVWAHAAIAMRALDERVPLFYAVGLLGSQVCNCLLCLMTLVECDVVVLHGLFALGGQLGEPATERVARSAALSCCRLVGVRAPDKVLRRTVSHVRFLPR